MDFSELQGKIAIVSGSGGNLGPVWCKTLTSHGVKVYGFDVDDVPDPDYDFYQIDIRIQKEIDNLKKLMAACNHFPNIIINNAAIDHPPQRGVNFWTETEKIIDVNLLGAVRLTKTFIGPMKKKGGVIINIGSIQGFVAADHRNYESGFRKPGGYNMSKAALLQFTRSICCEFGENNIRSVCLAFGAVDTGKFKNLFKTKFLKSLPLGRFVSVESCKKALLFACTCPEFTGQPLLIDSGYTSW